MMFKIFYNTIFQIKGTHSFLTIMHKQMECIELVYADGIVLTSLKDFTCIVQLT